MSSKRPSENIFEWLGFTKQPNFKAAHYLGPALGVAVILLFLLALAAALVILVQIAFTGKAGLGAGALIVAILGFPFLLWNTVIRQRTVDFQKEGHLTDRITKAVEQLGAEKVVKEPVGDRTLERSEPNLEVRMGGLLSLERIAQDSTEYDRGRDHVRVMEIICAYIRNNASASKARDREPREWLEERVGGARGDIRIALSILSRRNLRQKSIEMVHPEEMVSEPDWISGMPLPQRGIDESVEKFRARFAKWWNAYKRGGGFVIDLAGLNFQSVGVGNLDLDGVMLLNARFEGAKLPNLSLKGSVISDASFDGASLRNVHFDEASILYSTFDEADLEDVSFYGALLIGIDFRSTNVTQPQIDSCFGDITVLIPERLERPLHWSTSEISRDAHQTEWLNWRVSLGSTAERSFQKHNR